MLIRQHENGYHYVHFYDGKRSRTLSLRTRCSTEAHRLASVRLAEIANKRDYTVTPTVEMALDHYWRHHAGNLPSHKTIRRIIATLKTYFGPLVPQQVTPELVRRFKQQRGKAQGTIRKELGVLSAALNYGVRQGLLTKDSVPYIDVPPMGKPRDKWATWEQLDKLQEVAATMRGSDGRLTRAERFLAIAINTGARKRAIEELKWSAISFDAGLIDFTLSQKESKRTKRRAVVPISDALMPVLRRAYSERQGELVLDNDGCIKSALKRVTRVAGLSWISPHVIRHSFASLAAMSGVSLLEIARVLGNGIAVVERVYAKHTPGYLKSAVNFRRAG